MQQKESALAVTETETAQSQARKQAVTELKTQLEQLDQQLTESAASRQQLEQQLQEEQHHHRDVQAQTRVSQQVSLVKIGATVADVSCKAGNDHAAACHKMQLHYCELLR